MNGSPAKISMLALVLLITGSIDSVRNLPSTALFGATSVFFFILSALFFLIPVALISAELSSTWSEEDGGVYSWVHHAFGRRLAFFTIWLQWINTLVWYPTILSFIAGTLAYLIHPELAQNKFYLISVILIVFWSLTLLGLFGLKASARFAGFCAVIGMLIPMGFIIILGLIWIINGHPLAISMNLRDFIPHMNSSMSWSSLTAIMTAYLGMELAAVHVRNVAQPQRNFPLAMLCSVLLILITMICGSLAISVVLPQEKISLVQGVMQAFHNFFAVYDLMSLLPITVIMILIGSVGSMVNWIISPAKGLLLAADHGFLPQNLYKLNQHGIPARILILQAIVVTLLCGGVLLFPTINAIYWLFTDLSTELYILMYVMLFLAAIRLKHKFAHLPRPFKVPFGNYGYYLTCCLGLIGCAVTLIVGFFPPASTMEMGSANHFRMIFSLGMLLMIFPVFIAYGVQAYKQKGV